ncbi:AT-rich interactive domain-containing protein 4B-like [Chelonus insularis]|uniref:AT-rich interactive domain-containing protein 4B-like n=1 Tax=Chelonus insularis TaxID=460826 RepID=UPI001588C756|nr:AT-rich interactive domain-containing protein 4B-like [Chelonus insularis]
MAEDTEVLPDNTKHIEEVVEEASYIEEEKVEKIQNAESSMLEDETMPTYLSITSITASPKPNDSKALPENSSPRSVTQDEKSVYDVSSEDESDRPAYDGEHDDGGYGDSDDFEQEEESDDEENDDEDEETEIDEENDDDDIEPEQFERSSDDYVLKSSAAGLNKHCKERSRSLQDLSSTGKRSGKMNCKKQMILVGSEYETGVMKENPLYKPVFYSKQILLPSIKYNNIPMKVKRYIEDLKDFTHNSDEQKSHEKPTTVHEISMGNYNMKEMNQDDNNLIMNLQTRCLQDRNDRRTPTIKSRESPSLTEVNINNHVIENGVEMHVFDVKDSYNRSNELQMEVDLEEDHVKDVNYNEQIEKLNGKVKHDKENIRKMTMNYKETEKKEPEDLIKSEKQGTKMPNLQTISNRNFTNKNTRENHRMEEPKVNKDQIEYIVDNETMIKPMNITSIIEAHNAKKIMIDETMMAELRKKEIECEEKSSEIMILQSQLNNKEQEFEKIGKEYRKVVDMISELKKERENLKQMLEKLENEKKSRTVQEVAVQTEDQPKTMIHTSTKTQLQPSSAKISMSSIGSTLSSIEQWTASDYSPVVSMNPPTIGNIINSDTSTAVNTPKNKTTANSPRTVLTTTRIIQALASLTPGKTDENVGGQLPNVQGQSEETNTPLMQKESNSRKRKASETFESSACGSKPFKIPFISINNRRKFNSNSDTDAAGEPSGSSRCGLTENDGVNRIQKKKQENDNNEDDDVKCIVWHENGQSKQRSCLIQASIAEDSPKTKGQVRHCGPYLLGNVEVRISEANGTLNIWGKEINSVEDQSDNSDECLSDKINIESLWSKASSEKMDYIPCSKNKKAKTASSVKASICRHLRSIINRTPSPVNHCSEEEISGTPNHHHCGNSTCGFKEINKSKNLQKSFASSCESHFNNLNSPDKQFCCLHKGEESVGECGFKKDEGMTDNIHYLYDMTRTIIGQDSKSTINPINNKTYNCYKSHMPCEENSENYCRRSSLIHQCNLNSETEDSYPRNYKRSCYHSPEIINRNPQVRNDDSDLHMCGASCPDEEVFLPPRFPEVLEEKKNRYRSKRVRTLMEFFKGCSDCKNPHTTSFDSSHIPETISTNTRSIPTIRIDSAPSNLSCPKQSSNNSSDKKCCSCKKHVGVPTDIEAELAEFRVAITNLNSKSDALREMLSRVLNTD